MKKLIDDIETYCSSVGMAPSTLGLRAAGDGKFVTRLKAGGRCWPETEDRVRAYMAKNPPAPEEKGAA